MVNKDVQYSRPVC